jgi:protein ImuA
MNTPQRGLGEASYVLYMFWMASSTQDPQLAALRVRIMRLERGASRQQRSVATFGVPAIDRHLPDGGLLRGVLHEIAGAGPELEHGAAAALFIAGWLARVHGYVLWVLERADLFAPALAGVGLAPHRVVYAEAGNPDAALLAMEEGLRHPGLAAVVGEISGTLSLTASRRLQLAAEASGVTAIVLRRSRRHDDPVLAEPTAAMTRWRLSALPSPPPLPQSPDVPGLGPAHWRLELVRCRGGEPSTWIMEACDAKGRLRLAANLADRSAAQAGLGQLRRTAGHR